jgi:hypothetical protein
VPSIESGKSVRTRIHGTQFPEARLWANVAHVGADVLLFALFVQVLGLELGPSRR